jgi:hypothetical protein
MINTVVLGVPFFIRDTPSVQNFSPVSSEHKNTLENYYVFKPINSEYSEHDLLLNAPSVQKLSPVLSINTVEIYYVFKPKFSVHDLLDLVILFPCMHTLYVGVWSSGC